jgi:homocysteine S-methyltransferase
MLAKARICHLAGIDAINIPDGPRASARVSPMIASIAIQQQIGIEAVLHYCCRDRNLLGMQSDLMGANASGVHNVLIITGDPPKIGDYPDMTGVFDVDSIGLVQMASNLNHGRDLGGTPVAPPSELLIGVGVNPCAVDPDREFERYRLKIEAGANFAITQPVFNPEMLLRFLERAQTLPRQIPIIAGVWPLVSFKNAEFMNNEVPGVEIPDGILERMHGCNSKEAGIQTGCQIARDIRDTIEDAVAGFQVSAPFGKVELALDVLI